MSSTRYAEFSITTDDWTSIVRIDDRRFTTFPIEANLSIEVSYSIVGAAIANGNLYDGKLAWTGAQFLIKEDDYLTLQGLIRRQELLRRNGDDFSIQFDNVLNYFVDPTAIPTRAVATGGVVNRPDGTIIYFARHNVAITSFSVDKNGAYYTASMDWVELDLSA